MTHDAIIEWNEERIRVAVGCDIATIFLGSNGTKCGISTGSDGGFEVEIRHGEDRRRGDKMIGELVFRGRQMLLEYDCGDEAAVILEPADGGSFEPFGFFRRYESKPDYDENDDEYYWPEDRYVIELFGKWRALDPTGKNVMITFP